MTKRDDDNDLLALRVGDKQEQDFCTPLEHMTVDFMIALAEEADRKQQVWSIGGMVVDFATADTIQHVQPAMDDLYETFVHVVRDWAIKNRVELKPKPTAS